MAARYRLGLPPPALVVFDLDGTLLDTFDDILSCLDEAFGVHGLAAPSTAAVRAVVSEGARRMIALLLPEGAPSVQNALFETYQRIQVRRPSERARIMDGVSALLDILEHEGVPRWICTNKLGTVARLIVEHWFPGRFAGVVGAGDVPILKPSPEPLLRIAHEAGVEPKSCWMIGDGLPDILAAKAAGMPSVALLGGFGPRDALRALGATISIESLAELVAAWPPLGPAPVSVSVSVSESVSGPALPTR